MAQNTNLNISPYFDDFDDDKGFLKVLFKPGFPVQARELTTLQSLLQNQIDTFGQGVYKEGSMVVPGGITLNRNYPVVLVQNNYLNLPVELYREALNGKVVKGATSNIRARINFSISATTSTRGYVSFYVTYLTKADDNETSVFQSGEILTCEEDITYSTSTIVAGTPLAQLLNSNSTSIGSTANVGKGVYFVRGQFVVMGAQALMYSFGLWLVGLNYAVLLGLLAGVAALVPYAGAVIGIGSAIIVGYFQFGLDPVALGLVASVFMVGQLVESFLLTPILIGDRIGLHPVAVIFALMAGGQLAGFTGVLVALPVAAVLLVFGRRLVDAYLSTDVYNAD